MLFLLSLIDTEAVLRWNTTGLTIAGVTNQPGNASNKLNAPFGLALNYSNTLYIVDSYNNRVQKYLRDSSFGETVAGQKTGLSGSDPNTFNYSTGLALEVNGDIYVSDVNNHRIQLWTSGSTIGVTVAGTGKSTLNISIDRDIIFVYL